MKRDPNHLAGQTSPYLLQHVHNPVDWHPWGPHALERARREDRPIFLSIGYAACHWCHVMERESFENEAIAAMLNDRFVPIKVDREERPDLDDVYMSAVQLMIGQGGWPLNVFLTPDLKPFFGGTYFPPEDRWGRAGLPNVLAGVAEAWRSRRDEIERSAGEIVVHLRTLGEAEATGSEPVGPAESASAAADLAARFDAAWGGFGGAPKFPPHGAIALLLREHARRGEAAPLSMATATLDRMALGGMYDHVGGGFARYSTDERWLVPHFEKMLYDQALLVAVYVDAWRVTEKPLYRRVVEETLDFVRRELTAPGGGFASSLDADSEGHEGRFYVWTPAEVDAVLGPKDGGLFSRTYGITPEGNFEGASIANLLEGPTDEALVARLAPMRAKLLEARGRRIRPGTDDKVLTAWNGLMIGAFARAHQAFGRDGDLAAARAAADFVKDRLTRDGRLLVSWREGKAHLPAYLDDHAFLARGLLDLYETSFERRDLDAATALAREMVARFSDGSGGFHFTSDDHEELPVRPRSLHDGALPSGAGVGCEVLLRLALHRDDSALREAALATLRFFRPWVERAPSAFASMLQAADLAAAPGPEIAIVGRADDPRRRVLLAEVGRRYLPGRVVAAAAEGEQQDLPLLRGRGEVGGAPAAYVCRGYACRRPVTDPAALRAQIGA